MLPYCLLFVVHLCLFCYPPLLQVCAGYLPGAVCQHGGTTVERLLQLCYTPKGHRCIRAFIGSSGIWQPYVAARSGSIIL
jgi:hypothetical protein